ncbi:MAG: alpha/beta fold hydrolase, partial [Pseudomonadota bacterium]
IERGGGQLLIKQTDATKFKVGENMAVTPGKVIFRNEVMELIQYAPMTEQVERRPVLICPPWINKYYILDLNPKKSLVKWLLEQGHTVFMISWVNPDARHRDKEFVDYIAEGLFEAVVRVLDECEAEDLHLASYCIGGTMTATALAYLAQQEDHPLRGRIASATFFTAQFEFTDAGELQLFVDDPQLRHLESQMPDGYLPAEKMAGAFNMLRASDLIWSYVISNYMLGRDPFPFDLLTWNSDSTNMPGKVHTYYLEKFYRDNALADGALQLGHSVLDLASVDLPTYHVATREDHIAPAASVYRGVQAIGGDKRFVLAGSGHIAGVVNPPAGGKYQFWARDDGAMPEGGVEAWFEGAEESPGSWWGDWDGWMKALNGAAEKVPGRQPGRRHNALADAPGEYVRIPFTAARERGSAAGEADAAE